MDDWVGDKMRFWLDEWVGGQSLTYLFPRLFLISDHKENLIGSLGQWIGERWCLELSWRRTTFEWENVLINNLFSILDTVQVYHSCLDSWIWKWFPSRTYTTNTTYKALLVVGSIEEPKNIYTDLWRLRIPNKVGMLLWRALKNRLPTRDNIKQMQYHRA